MYIEAVNGVDAHCQYLLGVLLAAACRCGENSHVDVLQLAYVLHHTVWSELRRLVLRPVAPYYSRYLEV